MPERVTLHAQLIDISRDYLGPAAERFIDRQVTTHLQKEPLAVTRDDLLKLIDWIRLAFALLTNDHQLVEEYEQRIRALAKAKQIRPETRHA